MLNIDSEVLGKSSYIINMFGVVKQKPRKNCEIKNLPNKTPKLKLLAGVFRLTKKEKKLKGNGIMKMKNLPSVSGKGNIKYIEVSQNDGGSHLMRAKQQLALPAPRSGRKNFRRTKSSATLLSVTIDDEQDFDDEIQVIVNILKNAVIKLNENTSIMQGIDNIGKIATAAELLLEQFSKKNQRGNHKDIEKYFLYISDIVSQEKSVNKNKDMNSTINKVNNSVRRLFAIRVLQNLNSIRKTNKQTWSASMDASRNAGKNIERGRV